MFYHNERMKRTILLLLLSVLFSGLSYAQAGYFISSDRFSSSLISDLCQDRQGSVWIGTDYGLNRFDGYRFQTFLHDDKDPSSLSVNVVVSLLNDREGRLWIGTNRGLDRFDHDTETFVHYPFPNNIQPRVSSLCQSKDGSILVGTSGYGIFKLGPSGKLEDVNASRREMYFSRLFEDSRGWVWKSGFDESIVVYDGKKVTRFKSQVGNPQGFVEHDGEVLVVCLHGFMSYRNGKMGVANIDVSQAKSREAVFTNVSIGEGGNIYIGTRGQGLYRLSSGHSRRLERVAIDAYGIDSNTAKVSSILFDRSGNMWLGCHRKGLLLMPLRPMPFKNWNFLSQGVNLGSTISSVCEGDNGMVWCTVQGVGIYGFNTEGRVVAHPASPDAVEFIFRDRQQRYWVGTDDGLFAYDPVTGRSELKVTYDCDRFNDMTSDPSGRIYISTYSRGFISATPWTIACQALLSMEFSR